MCLVIFNQNNFLSLLKQYPFSDDVFTGTRVGQPVTHFRWTNRKPQPSNQFSKGKIKSRPNFFLVLEAISLEDKSQ